VGEHSVGNDYSPIRGVAIYKLYSEIDPIYGNKHMPHWIIPRNFAADLMHCYVDPNAKSTRIRIRLLERIRRKASKHHNT
jgi:hypothetical protein